MPLVSDADTYWQVFKQDCQPLFNRLTVCPHTFSFTQRRLSLMLWWRQCLIYDSLLSFTLLFPVDWCRFEILYYCNLVILSMLYASLYTVTTCTNCLQYSCRSRKRVRTYFGVCPSCSCEKAWGPASSCSVYGLVFPNIWQYLSPSTDTDFIPHLHSAPPFHLNFSITFWVWLYLRLKSVLSMLPLRIVYASRGCSVPPKSLHLY